MLFHCMPTRGHNGHGKSLTKDDRELGIGGKLLPPTKCQYPCALVQMWWQCTPYNSVWHFH